MRRLQGGVVRGRAGMRGGGGGRGMSRWMTGLHVYTKSSANSLHRTGVSLAWTVNV